MNGLENVNNEEIIVMKPLGRSINPLKLYIQIMDKEKFLVFLYPIKRPQHVHFNGTDKHIEEYHYAKEFKIGNSSYEYKQSKWVKLT